MNRPEVLVIGSGVMGRGIAKGFAAAGISSAIFSRNAAKVAGVDPRVALLDRRALQDLYAAGHLGIKTGKGFYDWSGKDPNRVKAEAARKLTELLAYLQQQG